MNYETQKYWFISINNKNVSPVYYLLSTLYSNDESTGNALASLPECPAILHEYRKRKKMF